MKRYKSLINAASVLASACAVLVLMTTAVIAKRATIGIYAIVDRITFEPTEQSPDRVRIWGVFVVPIKMSSGEYQSPQRGSLYFKVRLGMERVAREEWAELKVVAGSGGPVGFAQYWVPDPSDASGNPHHSLAVWVRNERDEGTPDLYPMPHPRGIVKTGDIADPDFDRITAQLQRAVRPERK